MSSIDELENYTAKERCDVCNAQSFFMVTFETGDLFFCRHHFMKHEEIFYKIADDIIDESDLLGS